MVVVAFGGTYVLVSSHALTPYSNPYSCPTHPLLQYGSTGTCVKYVQYTLHVAVSGSFDSATKTAVQHFQFDNKIANSGCGSTYTSCDGKVGSYTWPKIDSYNASQTQAAQPTNNSAPTGSVAYTQCNTQITGSEYDADRPNDGARVILVAGGTTYTVTSTTRSWSWTIPAALKNSTSYSIAVSGRNVNSAGAFAGTNTTLSGSPVKYSYAACAPKPTPTTPPVTTTPPTTTPTTPPATTSSPSTTTSAPATTSARPRSTSLQVVPNQSASATTAAPALDVTTPTTAETIDTTVADGTGDSTTTGDNTASGNTNSSSSTTPVTKKAKTSLVKTVIIGFFGSILLLALLGGAFILYFRRRTQPSYDTDMYAALPTTQPPAGPTADASAVPPPLPYAPPVANDAVAQSINQAFYPNQPPAAASTPPQAKLPEEPDMFEIAKQHPESFGNAHYVNPEPGKPPEAPKS